MACPGRMQQGHYVNTDLNCATHTAYPLLSAQLDAVPGSRLPASSSLPERLSPCSAVILSSRLGLRLNRTWRDVIQGFVRNIMPSVQLQVATSLVARQPGATQCRGLEMGNDSP